MTFTPTFDDRGLRDLAKRFEQLGAKGRREVERTVSSVRRATGTESVRAITATYNLAQKYVRSGIRVRPTGLRGFEIRGANRPIPAHHYGGKALSRGGVAVAYRRGRRIVIEDGFPGEAPQGGLKLWQRTGQPKTRPTRGRYAGRNVLREPIEVIVGPSPADHLLNRTVRERLDAFVVRRLSNEVARRVSRLVARRG